LGSGAFLTLGGGLRSVQPELNYVENEFDVATPAGTAEVKLSYFGAIARDGIAVRWRAAEIIASSSKRGARIARSCTRDDAVT
jgi:hypothetical protein